MVNVNVKKQFNSQNKENAEQAVQRQEGGSGASSRRRWDPFSLSLMPSEFLSTNPFSLMRRLDDEMARIFGRFFNHEGTGNSGPGWYPAIEVAERNGQLQVHAELPGLKPET